ncbi:hypothetical protein B9479_004586 [Cryptococcus floricola]|uniref:Uncharacterized protein n=1 Tax=Cryptococcus floricola TaxID=2591691 RepID=A0A5D3AVF7_9TREE|nr:hypothetical protein B9479_004586 [Cryptococcus floricola]
MVLPEADISATPIDDGSFAPSQPQKKDPNDRSFQPNSPKLVIFNQRSGEKETIDLGKASSIMTMEDYRNLTRKCTERGMFGGLVGGGILTYLVKQFKPTPPSRNALALTFFLSASFFSFSSSRALLISEILKIREKARAMAIQNGDIPDPAENLWGSDGPNVAGARGMGDSPRNLPPIPQATAPDPSLVGSPGPRGYATGQSGRPSGAVGEELARARSGVSPDRAKWAQERNQPREQFEEDVPGPGEGEMVDPYASLGATR